MVVFFPMTVFFVVVRMLVAQLSASSSLSSLGFHVNDVAQYSGGHLHLYFSCFRRRAFAGLRLWRPVLGDVHGYFISTGLT